MNPQHENIAVNGLVYLGLAAHDWRKSSGAYDVSPLYDKVLKLANEAGEFTDKENDELAAKFAPSTNQALRGLITRLASVNELAFDAPSPVLPEFSVTEVQLADILIHLLAFARQENLSLAAATVARLKQLSS
jgi:hypothetical protein